MNKPRIKIITASAGSGKTYQLTLEYLEKLFSIFKNQDKYSISNNLSSIIAITFTNKASEEMKKRILYILKIFSIKTYSELNQTDKSVFDELNKRGINFISKNLSQYIIDLIFSNYSDFNVKTIDSLMSQIITVISPDINYINPDFEFSILSNEFIEEKIIDFINNYVDSNLDNFNKIINSILSVEGFRRWDIENNFIINFLNLFNKSHSQYELYKNINSYDLSVDKYDEHLQSLKKTLGKFIIFYNNNKKDIKKNKITESSIIKFNNFINDNKFENILGISYIDEFQDIDSLVKKNTPLQIKESLNQYYLELRNNLSNFSIQYSKKKIFNYFSLYIEFLKYWKSNKSIIFINELYRILLDQIEIWDYSGPPYIFLKLSEKFDHYLIDEFQDTSELQFQSLSYLIKDSLTNENNSLFIVGDKKQAIYRFRGGNAELLDANKLVEILNYYSEIEKQTLLNNRRSLHNIVNFNNHFWSEENLNKLFHSSIFTDKIIKNFINSKQIPSVSNENKGFIEIYFPKKDKPDITNTDFINSNVLETIIKLKKTNYTNEDITILVRTKREIRDLLNFLTINGIKDNIQCISDESLFLSSSFLINEIISLFQFIIYPKDNLNFYNFINSNVFKSNIKNYFKDKKVIINANDFINKKIYYLTFKTKFPELWKKYFSKLMRSSLTIYDLFQDIVSVFKLFENFQDQAIFILSFGELLYNFEKNNIYSISSFLEEWEKITNSKINYSIGIPENTRSIRIMTMHKCKGLEFPIVIIPIYDRNSNRDFPLYFDDKELYYISKNLSKINIQLENIYNTQLINEYIDKLNTLYVSMTRAKVGLFITGIHPKPKKDIILNGFGNIVCNNPEIRLDDKGKYQKGLLNKNIKKEEIIISNSEIIKYPKSKNIPITDLTNNYFTLNSDEDQFSDNIERGVKFHKIFSYFFTFKSKIELQDKIIMITKLFNLTTHDCNTLNSFLLNDNIIPLFVGDFEVNNEIDIYDKSSDKLYRLDRLIKYKNHFEIIDYKTGNKNNNNNIQIKKYLDIMKNIYPDISIKAFLLYIDLKIKIEIK